MRLLGRAALGIRQRLGRQGMPDGVRQLVRQTVALPHLRFRRVDQHPPPRSIGPGRMTAGSTRLTITRGRAVAMASIVRCECLAEFQEACRLPVEYCGILEPRGRCGDC